MNVAQNPSEPSEQCRQFCSIKTAPEAANYALTISYQLEDKTLKKTWEDIKTICENPLTAGLFIDIKKSLIETNKLLGADITLKVYEHYLHAHDKEDQIPNFMLPQTELISIVDASNLEHRELLKLHSLSNKLAQKEKRNQPENKTTNAKDR